MHDPCYLEADAWATLLTEQPSRALDVAIDWYRETAWIARHASTIGEIPRPETDYILILDIADVLATWCRRQQPPVDAAFLSVATHRLRRVLIKPEPTEADALSWMQANEVVLRLLRRIGHPPAAHEPSLVPRLVRSSTSRREADKLNVLQALRRWHRQGTPRFSHSPASISDLQFVLGCLGEDWDDSRIRRAFSLLGGLNDYQAACTSIPSLHAYFDRHLPPAVVNG